MLRIALHGSEPPVVSGCVIELAGAFGKHWLWQAACNTSCHAILTSGIIIQQAELGLQIEVASEDGRSLQLAKEAHVS